MFRSRAVLLAAAAAALCVLAPARRADAQIVNVQGQLAKPPEEDGVHGQIEAKADWREGNIKLLDVSGTATLIVKRGPLLALALARGGYGRAGENVFNRRTLEHVRLRYTLDCRWRWEVFGQHEYDRFRRLFTRVLAGTGPALQVLSTSKAGLLAGATYMFELEQLDQRMGAADAGDRTVFHRGSFYLTGTQNFGENVSVAETIYVQPRLDDPGDVRVLVELSVTSKLTKRLALGNALIYAYDRRPPDLVNTYDSQLRVSLILQL